MSVMFPQDAAHMFPRAVGWVCCHMLRLSGKVCSFLFFPLLLTGQLRADQVNTLCGSLVWSFALITHCHPVKSKSHIFPFAPQS